jgi:hypothetical protein
MILIVTLGSPRSFLLPELRQHMQLVTPIAYHDTISLFKTLATQLAFKGVEVSMVNH